MKAKAGIDPLIIQDMFTQFLQKFKEERLIGPDGSYVGFGVKLTQDRANSLFTDILEFQKYENTVSWLKSHPKVTEAD